jgi:hypothetical protein
MNPAARLAGITAVKINVPRQGVSLIELSW